MANPEQTYVPIPPATAERMTDTFLHTVAGLYACIAQLATDKPEVQAMARAQLAVLEQEMAERADARVAAEKLAVELSSPVVPFPPCRN